MNQLCYTQTRLTEVIKNLVCLIGISLPYACSDRVDLGESDRIADESTAGNSSDRDCHLPQNACDVGFQCVQNDLGDYSCQSENAGTDDPHQNPNDPSDLTVCEPTPETISILPRSSNYEVWQIYSDLLGVPLDAALFAHWTPLAQVRGFDHMTESRIDSQTLEEQLRTTEAVAERLINTAELFDSCPPPMEQVPLCTLHAVYDAQAQFSNHQGTDCWHYLAEDESPLTFDDATQRWMSNVHEGIFIWNTGLHPGVHIDVIRRWSAPVDGAVSLRGTIGDADPGGGDGIIAEIRHEGNLLFQTMIANGGAEQSYDLSFNVRQGDKVDILIRRNQHNSWDTTGLSAVLSFTPILSSAEFTWSNCGREIVDHIASRAWRRPLRAEELNDLQQVFDEVFTSAESEGIANAFFEGLQSTLQAALLSPHVHYKPEFVSRAVPPTEVNFSRASRLSLYFRSSFPDEELWALAAAGTLSDAELKSQAERLLGLNTSRFVDNFGGQWLNFRSPIGVDETDLARSMRRESHDVLAAIITDQLEPVDLIKPGFTIVDGQLAAHYGLTSVDINSGPIRVETDERGGLFTQGHFLTSGSSGSEFKRVIHRGIYALNRTLCSSIPPLDPATLEEIAATSEVIDPLLPLAERMELHRDSAPRCIGCHSQMDPLGLALERFDQEGRVRSAYPDGSPIDNHFEFNGNSVRNPEELNVFIGESEEYRRCVAEKLLTFGLSRALRFEEQCLIDRLVEAPRSLHELAIEAFIDSLKVTELP